MSFHKSESMLWIERAPGEPVAKTLACSGGSPGSASPQGLLSGVSGFMTSSPGEEGLKNVHLIQMPYPYGFRRNESQAVVSSGFEGGSRAWRGPGPQRARISRPIKPKRNSRCAR